MTSAKPKPNRPLTGRQRVGLAARKVAARILGATLDEGKNPDVLMDTETGISAYNTLIAKDRALIRAIVMMALRRRLQVDDALGRVLDRAPPRKARHLAHTLSVAATQILFLDIPDSAAVNLAVTAISEDRRTARFAALANAVLRRLSREKAEILADQDAIELSMPGWLRKRLKKAYGRQRAAAIAAIILEEPALDLTVKSDAAKWAEKLSGIVLPNGSVRLKPKGPVSALAGYDEGAWWIQDAAAAIPATLFGDVSGQRIADLCAAPGGKTAQLAAMGADVTAVDISRRRMQRLKANLARLALGAETILADILEWRPDALFDAVLLDAPCSSTGTMRRHPDVKWNKSPEEIAELAELQFRLCNRAIEYVKPGGTVVFANCSLDRTEGEDLFARILAERGDIEPMPLQGAELPGLETAITGQGTLRTLPTHFPHQDIRYSGMDGFFAARFRRI